MTAAAELDGEHSWIDGDRVKSVSKAIGDAWAAVDRLYFHSPTNADIVKHANEASEALNRVRREARANSYPDYS